MNHNHPPPDQMTKLNLAKNKGPNKASTDQSSSKTAATAAVNSAAPKVVGRDETVGQHHQHQQQTQHFHNYHQSIDGRDDSRRIHGGFDGDNRKTPKDSSAFSTSAPVSSSFSILSNINASANSNSNANNNNIVGQQNGSGGGFVHSISFQPKGQAAAADDFQMPIQQMQKQKQQHPKLQNKSAAATWIAVNGVNSNASAKSNGGPNQNSKNNNGNQNSDAAASGNSNSSKTIAEKVAFPSAGRKVQVQTVSSSELPNPSPYSAIPFRLAASKFAKRGIFLLNFFVQKEK